MVYRARSKRALLLSLVLLIIVLLASVLISILYGLQAFHLRDVWQAYTAFNGSNEHLIITNTRVPRALIAAVVGGSLAVAGAIMQALTRNALASPSLFGVNAGASLFVVAALALWGSGLALSDLIWFAFAGAAAAAGLVYVLGNEAGRVEPSRLALAGAAIAAFAASMTSGLILVNKQSLDDALFWMIGSVSGRSLDHLLLVLPYIAVGAICCLFLPNALNIMALGEESAQGLGLRTRYTQLLSAFVVILLAGSAVAAAGPIAFVGLIIPHLCRAWIGNDHRWLLPYCAVSGAVLLVLADTLARFVVPGKEVPVGIATVLLGVPFLIRVARGRKHA